MSQRSRSDDHLDLTEPRVGRPHATPWLAHLDVTRLARGDDLALLRPARHLSNVFRPLVQQQHQEFEIVVIRFDRTNDVLEHSGLAGLRRPGEQYPLNMSLPENLALVASARKALAAHLAALQEVDCKVQREEALQRPWGSVLIA